MIDISKGRYWDLPLSLIDGCTPCSPGCDHCWSAGIEHRFDKTGLTTSLSRAAFLPIYDLHVKFTGKVVTHPDRLTIPLKRRKPTVYAVWNDLFHEDVEDDFVLDVLSTIALAPRHTFLVLTKRSPMDFYGMCGTDKEWWRHSLSRNAGVLFGEEADCHVANAIEGCLGEGHNVGWPMSNLWHGLTVCNQEEAAPNRREAGAGTVTTLRPLHEGIM